MKVAGCDAGKAGAVAVLDTATQDVDILDIPLDGHRDLDTQLLFQWLLERSPDRLVVEDCWQPKTLVLMCGEVAAVAKLLGADFRRVAVSTWKKAVLGENTSDKQRSIEQCKILAPQALLRKPKCRTDSPDRAEAVLLAIYAATLG